LSLTQTDERPYVIGEIGFNHNGDVETAHELIKRLAEAGADCAKVQLFRTDHLVSNVHQTDAVEVFREHELSKEDYRSCKAVAKENGIDLAASVFDREILDWYVEETDPPFVKVASGDLTFKRLLTRIGEHDRPVVMSTGGGTFEEINRAVDWIGTDERELYILHCISRYPAPDESLNLRRIETLRSETGHPAGFSDHSQSNTAPLIAAALGSAVWERHVTLDSDQDGPEHEFSMEVDRLGELIDQLEHAAEMEPDEIDEDAETLLGSPEIELTDADREFRKQGRRSLMADRALSVGTALEEDMIRELRPGTGLPPERYEDVLGLPIQRPTEPQEMITY
jgi:N,N'-diacetyllegionaminate synthase